MMPLTISDRKKVLGGLAFYLFTGAPAGQWQAQACTTFCIESTQEKAFGKSYDWHLSHGMAVVNKRNVSKKALMARSTDKPASWTSKFGSITLNQYGRDFPNGGINEAGLVVEVMILGESRYPSASTGKLAVNELQWVQYQLDQYETIDEVVEHVDDVRIANVMANLHYLACDRSGSCASIEWLNGQAVVHSGKNLPWAALTNSTYADASANLSSYEGFGGTRPIPRSYGSIDRFIRTAHNLRTYNDSRGPAVTQAFNMLEDVASGMTQWQVVYEGANNRAHFRTKNHLTIKSIDGSNFNYDCKSPVTVLDMDTDLEGDVSDKFSSYTEAMNRVIVEKSVKGSLPPALIEQVVKYPSTTTCQSGNL